MNPLPKKPKIILLANDRVGLAIAQYLKSRRENIVALVLHPQNKAKSAKEIRAIFHGIPVFLAESLCDPGTLSRLARLGADIAISAWFGYILKSNFVNLFSSGIVNFHNSYLPLNRGKYPHVWAIATASKYGVTLHYIDEGIDMGDIIARREIKVRPTDTAGTLYTRALDEIVELFKDTWPKLKDNKIHPIIQRGDTTHHFAREVIELDYIDLNKKYRGEDLINQIRSRSFQDRSYAYFEKNGRKIYVKITLSDEQNF